jgi:hypothetical protein
MESAASFSTIYNDGGSKNMKAGLKKISAFEVINLLSAKNMNSIFDIKPKKASSVISLNSAFTKKKGVYKIS